MRSSTKSVVKSAACDWLTGINLKASIHETKAAARVILLAMDLSKTSATMMKTKMGYYIYSALKLC